MTKSITVSYSEVKDARRCDFMHDLKWRRYYRKEHRKDCDCALCFGIAWHDTMEAYYQGLNHTYDFGAAMSYDANGLAKGAWHAAKHTIETKVPEHLRDRIRWMLEGYAAWYGRESEWKILATEKQLIVPLPQLYDDLVVYLKVKIDLIVQNIGTGKLWVTDHKTCSQLPTDRKMVDPQLPLYCYALRECGEKWDAPFGTWYSYALKPCKTLKFRKEPELSKRFKRRLVPLTDNEIYSTARDCYKRIYMRYMAAELFDRPERSVQPDCAYCDFERACTASRKGYLLEEFLSDCNIKPYTDKPPKSPAEPK